MDCRQLKINLMVLYEDNVSCIAQIKVGYIKIHMSFKIMVILIFSKYAQVTIFQIYLQNPCQLQHSKNWYTKLGCINSKIFVQILKNQCQDERDYTYWGK